MHRFKLIILTFLAAFIGGLRQQFATANVEGTVGTHEHTVTRLTDAAITTRHLLFKKGSDDYHTALAAAADIPLGTIDDEALAAEEPKAIRLLGRGPTKRMVALAAIGAGVRVYTAAGGQVQVAPTGATVSLVGVSLTAAVNAGDIIEVNDCAPVSVTFA